VFVTLPLRLREGVTIVTAGVQPIDLCTDCNPSLLGFIMKTTPPD
jgi:hypothetical protein